MLSMIPEEARAVLIGASEFPRDPEHLPALPAVKANVRDLAAILCNPDIVGLPEENVITILDERKASDVQERLARICREALDTLIVYYAGHGLVGKTSSQLFLACVDTTESEAEFNGIPFAVVRAAMANSSAKKKVLILDSCFSGRALKIMSGESSLLQSNLDLKGSFAMASAPANRASIAPPGEKYTAFSGQLIEALNNGIDNDREEITLRELYEHIRDHFRRRVDVPEPQHANIQDAEKVVFARNRRFMRGVDQKLESLAKKISGRIDELEVRVEGLASAVQRAGKAEGVAADGLEKRRPIRTRLLSACISLGVVFLPVVVLFALAEMLALGGIIYGGRTYVFVGPGCVFMVVLQGAVLVGALRAIKGRNSFWFGVIFPSWYDGKSAFRAALLGVLVTLGVMVLAILPTLVRH